MAIVQTSSSLVSHGHTCCTRIFLTEWGHVFAPVVRPWRRREDYEGCCGPSSASMHSERRLLTVASAPWGIRMSLVLLCLCPALLTPAWIHARPAPTPGFETARCPAAGPGCPRLPLRRHPKVSSTCPRRKAGRALVPGSRGKTTFWQKVQEEHMPPEKPLSGRWKQIRRRGSLRGEFGGAILSIPTGEPARGRLTTGVAQAPSPGPYPPREDAAGAHPIDLRPRPTGSESQRTLAAGEGALLLRRLYFDLTGLPPGAGRGSRLFPGRRSALHYELSAIACLPARTTRTLARHCPRLVRFV